MDAKFLDFEPDRTLKDKETLDLGDVKLKVIHTPGHTPGSICLYEPRSKSLFSGDTVFPFGSVGRTDLPGGDAKEIIHSIKRLKILYPGHGEISTKDVNEQIMNSLELVQNLV